MRQHPQAQMPEVLTFCQVTNGRSHSTRRASFHNRGKMRGQIIEKKKGVWLCRVQTRDIKGKLKSRSKVFRGTKKDAEKLLTQLLAEKDKGIIATPQQNLNQYLDL